MSVMCAWASANEYGKVNALKNEGWVVANVKSPVEIDCSELAACAVNVAYGKSMIPSSVYSGNIGKSLLNTGLFKELKASKYLGKSEYIECGDIIVAPGKHVIVAYTDGSKTSQNTIKTTVASAIGGNKLIKRAINLDYKARLVEDGKFGSASKKALGNHYVKKGEKQSMVTAAEILMYINGYNPNGVEYPGTYGNGLTSASKQKFGDDGLKITSSEFLQLI